jgi:hypothetical protein
MIAPTPSSPRPLPIEPILDENPGRFLLCPIQDDKAWAMYKKVQASIWSFVTLSTSKTSSYAMLSPISLQGKTNLSEKCDGECANSGIGVDNDYHGFSTAADF